jgi:hypothetical protein
MSLRRALLVLLIPWSSNRRRKGLTAGAIK